VGGSGWAGRSGLRPLIETGLSPFIPATCHVPLFSSVADRETFAFRFGRLDLDPGLPGPRRGSRFPVSGGRFPVLGGEACLGMEIGVAQLAFPPPLREVARRMWAGRRVFSGPRTEDITPPAGARPRSDGKASPLKGAGFGQLRNSYGEPNGVEVREGLVLASPSTAGRPRGGRAGPAPRATGSPSPAGRSDAGGGRLVPRPSFSASCPASVPRWAASVSGFWRCLRPERASSAPPATYRR